MKYLMFICLLSLSFCVNASDEASEIEGKYENENGLSMSITVLDDETGVVAVSAVTFNEGHCLGKIAGIGRYVDKTLKFSPYNEEVGTENCLISISFKDGKKGKKLGTISEVGDCSYFHGASCNFNGKLTRKVK